mmetsp:Transcript_5130/g.8237  ORF Transcript_5130/g.8237 Transcript_5130/m.8237 type:complete len:114 (+) Transcript_5130:92-433(+)
MTHLEPRVVMSCLKTPLWSSISSLKVPSCTTLPRSKTAILLALAIIDERWAIMSVLRPFIRFCKASQTRRSDSLSSADVASSKTRILGSLMIALAIATLWRWPPESCKPLSPT